MALPLRRTVGMITLLTAIGFFIVTVGCNQQPEPDLTVQTAVNESAAEEKVETDHGRSEPDLLGARDPASGRHEGRA